MQGVRVARDVNDGVELAHKLHGVRVQASPRRIDQNGFEVALRKIETLLLEPLEGLLVAEPSAGEVFAAAPRDEHVASPIFLDVVLCGRYRRLGNLRSHTHLKIIRHGNGEVAVPAVQLEQVVGFALLVACVFDRPLEHVNAHASIRLGEPPFQLLVLEVLAIHRQGFDNIVGAEHNFLLPASTDHRRNVALLEALRRPQGLLQLLRLGLPLVVQFSVVKQRDHSLPGKRGVEVGLEDLLR
mmetsp:Transcript_7991/g.16356  ORF Transcript_7991/g.16356 Transcript_7991/m.16356 type:complete len:241 (-) Transcript_7991:388-1110(-)